MTRRSTNNEEVSKAKAMLRAGEVTKPVYVRFCNRNHLLGLQIKKDKDREEARKAKQDLVTGLVGSKTANRARDMSYRGITFTFTYSF